MISRLEAKIKQSSLSPCDKVKAVSGLRRAIHDKDYIKVVRGGYPHEAGADYHYVTQVLLLRESQEGYDFWDRIMRSL